jgi:hypothetical protein
MSGEQHPNWKGGHRHWVPGRFGKDKDGLSWKIQRRLAWERDKDTCQECGKKGKRRPDVHHIVPYRISLSHALDNLRCLCKKCHITIEATCHEKWGGQLVLQTQEREEKKKCTKCGTKKSTQLVEGICYPCRQKILCDGIITTLENDASLRAASVRTLAKHFGTSHSTIFKLKQLTGP